MSKNAHRDLIYQLLATLSSIALKLCGFNQLKSHLGIYYVVFFFVC